MTGKETIKRWLTRAVRYVPARAISRGFEDAFAPKRAPQATPETWDASQLNEQYDAQTVAVMKRVLAPGANCIDVGCNRGTILDHMMRLAPRGQYFAFEPLPDLFAGLVAKYAGFPGVHLHELAMSEAQGESTFQHVVANDGYSGIKRRRYERPDEQVVEITVKIARLDDVLPPDIDIRLVKIDVEGAELQVLRGGTAMLRRSRPFVVFEHGRGAAEYYDTRPEQVFDLFGDYGLRVSLMKDWLAHGSAKAFTRAGFIDEFDTGRNFYYLAHPG